MSQLRQLDREFDAKQVKRILVTFDSRPMAENYVRTTEMKWPVVLDPDRELYEQFTMKRGSFWDLYNPLSILKYIYLILTSQRPGRPGSDLHQLGGDVLIDPEGVVRLLHRSEGPHDRPEPQDILSRITP